MSEADVLFWSVYNGVWGKQLIIIFKVFIWSQLKVKPDVYMYKNHHSLRVHQEMCSCFSTFSWSFRDHDYCYSRHLVFTRV